MTTGTVALPAAMGTWRSARAAVLALLLGLGALGFVFREEIAAALRVWSNSTA